MPADMLPVLPNPAARRLFLHLHGLGEPPSGPARGAELAALIGRLGFVQVDSITTVARAHHMILAARRPGYRPEDLARLMVRDRAVFEHWTHDAAVIPTAFYPHWRLRFARDRARLLERWRGWQRDGFETQFDTVLRQIADHGPVTSGDVGTDEVRGTGGWWDWHPSKAALEYLWRVGEIAVARRDGFTKVYDLTERVLPATVLATTPDPADTVDWACNAALDRLGFATSGEIAAFWATVTPEEARDWCRQALARGEIEDLAVIGADGSPRRSFARPGWSEAAAAAPDPPARLRILSPFDPALRDRARAERLFGFHYRIEVFVPEAKRRYGYYVFPLLEGARLVGRIDMRCDRGADCLQVRALWPERGVAFGAGRLARLEAELGRMARFAGVGRIGFDADWRRTAL